MKNQKGISSLIGIITIIIVAVLTVGGISSYYFLSNPTETLPIIKPITPVEENPESGCDSQLLDLEKLMSGFNYCNADSDCIKKDLGIMDFCGGHLINKNADLGGFNNKLKKYESDGCFKPIDDCQTISGPLKCNNNKCVSLNIAHACDLKSIASCNKSCSVDSDCKMGACNCLNKNENVTIPIDTNLMCADIGSCVCKNNQCAGSKEPECLKENEIGFYGTDKCCSGLKEEAMQTATIGSKPRIVCTK